ncbi:YbaB/EbfC family nucleoid-associated protein [Nocardia sp. NPDC051052]|uniref:YbaB/EbfC family nucleoid-associated protein n=1 Tax=Nocardia sp. NPDC051052 TaxID=3364322 RepID=UPI003798857C
MNEWLRADAALMIEAMSGQMQGIAKIQRDRARLTASVTACDKRITVTVNANGILIDTQFADDIGDLSYHEIAAAMTEAVQAAALKVIEQGRQLMEPLQERKTRLPRLSDLVADIPDIKSVIPVATPASTAPPNSPSRRQPDEAGDAAPFGRRSLINDPDD